MDIEELKELAYKKKKDLPVYATRITHKISIRIVDLLRHRKIEPDKITVLSIFLGMFSALLFCCMNKYCIVSAALILELYYIFDAVDGQLARAVKKTSLTGAYFDYISSHIVHSLVFLGIGFGLYLYADNIIYLIAGVFACWGMLFMYIIQDARNSVILVHGGGAARETVLPEPKSDAKGRANLKRAFVLLHEFCRYPTIMNVITIFAILNLLTGPGLFRILILFYAIALNIVWCFKLSKVILKKELG
ncbi:MAG: CDP-alcohol phosphatidyltransferase family protein [Candidatus Omnitrophota bacterium]